MKKSKILVLLLAVCTVLSMFNFTFANEENLRDGMLLISPNPMANNSIKVLLNDTLIDFTDENGNVVEPQIINNRTMVPMRKIFEVFDANVEWDAETRTIVATTDEKQLTLQIDNSMAKVKTSGDDEYVVEAIELDSAPVIYNNRTLVPVRFIAESLDLNVDWVPETKTVVVLDTSFVLEKIKKDAPNFYEFITNEYVTPNTLETLVKATATVNYKDEKKLVTNIKSTLDGKMKMNDEKQISLDITAKTTGKGDLYDSLKENGNDNVTLSAIMDLATKSLYLKSSLLKDEIGSKWLKTEAQLDDSLLKREDIVKDNVKYSDIIESLFDEIELTETTYEEVSRVVDLVCKFVSDKYFTVSGRTTKKYTYELTLKDILDILELDITEEELKESTTIANASIKFSTKVMNNYPMEATMNLELVIEEGTEQVEIKVNYEQDVQKLNEKVSIALPSNKNVVEFTDESTDIEL